MKKTKFYTVWIGRNPGVYAGWDACKAQVHGYDHAVFKGFQTIEEAEKAFLSDSKAYIGQNTFETALSDEELADIGEPVADAICVDGAWNTQTNEIEYQGVKYPQMERLFHAGPFNAGTNNIAEFLAIVHALAYCKEHQLQTPIYSDSRTAISWVRKKKAATKIEQVKDTEYILSVVARAEAWLKAHTFDNEILKWETAAWGENPADFGRK